MIGRFINRILLVSIIVLIIFFALIASFLYNKTNDIVIDFIETTVKKDLSTLENLIIDQEEQANKQFLYRIKIINNYINSQTISEQHIRTQIPVININTQEENIAILSPILIQGRPIDENFVKYIKFLSNTPIAIVQKFEDGYVVTFSDIDDLKRHGSKYYFPNNSEVALYIENKQTFVEKIKIKDNIYKLGIVPIFLGKNIKGAILLLNDQWFSEKFKTFFESQVYLNKGYPVLIDEQGNLLLHPLLEGENIKNTNIFYRIFSAKNTKNILKIEYRWPETASGQQKILYVKYMPQYGYFLAISLYKDDFYNYTQKFKTYYIIAVFLSLIISLIFILIIENLILQKINNVRKRLEQLSLGTIGEKIDIKGDNYIALEKVYNHLIDNFKKYTAFAAELSKGNYQYQFTPISNSDILGYNLLKIREHLQNVHKDIEKREQEERIRAWRNAGIEKFINILSHREEELSKWSFQIIKAGVEYLDAFQGGLFILEQDEQDQQPYFTLIACYAFNEEKIIDRKVPASAGLFAKLYKTPEILYIENIEENYQIITSALGQVKPNAIVLVPLIYNNLLIGAMEIDSFKKLEQYQLEFLKEIAGHISANLSSWKVAQETEHLLKRYEQQTEQFKQQQKELQEKIQQLSTLNTQYKNLEKEYNTTLNLIDQFAYRVELDENGKILSVNDKLASLYEKANSFFVGKYISEFTGFDILNPKYKEKWEQMLSGKIISTEESITLKEEQTIWMQQYLVAIRDTSNNIIKVLFIAIDITEARMLERQLRIQVKEISKETRILRREERKLRKEKEEFEKQKKQFEFLLNLYDKTTGRIVLNRSKKIIEVNTWIAEILNYTPEEMLNKPFENYILQTEKAKFYNNFKLALEHKEISDSYQFLRKDGNAIKLTIHFFLQDENKKNIKIYMLISP